MRSLTERVTVQKAIKCLIIWVVAILVFSVATAAGYAPPDDEKDTEYVPGESEGCKHG